MRYILTMTKRAPLSAAVGADPEADPDESEIIVRCRQGDQEAFRSIFERYQKRVFGLAFHVVADSDAARDIAQMTFIKAFQHIKTFEVDRRFYTWLYQIALNLSIDWLRRKKRRSFLALEEVDRRAPLQSESAGPHAQAALGEISERVWACLNALPAMYRAALVLRDIQGLTSPEIAEIFGTLDGTARWRIHQARKQFKALWVRAGESLDLEDRSFDAWAR